MEFYEAWQDMAIDNQWSLSDPFDNDGNELYGWRFTAGKKYDSALPLPSSVKIKQEGIMLPVSFGGLDVPYVNNVIKNKLSERCKNGIQFIPVRIEGSNLQYYIMNVVKLADAVSDLSDIEFYTEEEALKYPAIASAGKLKYIRNLIIDKKKLRKDENIFRLKFWCGKIYVREDVKDIIESAGNRHGVFFKKVTSL